MGALVVVIWAWRHARPAGVEGRCVGRWDVAVDRRRSKRLARRIQRHARRHGLPRVVCTSPLSRGRDVGRWLRRWGWRHLVQPALLEADFGTWEGRRWADIGQAAVDAWCAEFATHRPGGGEALAAVLQRAAAWVAPVPGCTVVAHAGWMLAREWVLRHGPGVLPDHAGAWPPSPPYGAGVSLPLRADWPELATSSAASSSP